MKSHDFSTFQFTANTINGKILEFPKLFYLRCSQVVPVGVQVVRQFDGNECINAISVFLVYSNGQLFGSTAYKSIEEFFNYMQANCRPVGNGCNITYNGCGVTYNGCQITANV